SRRAQPLPPPARPGLRRRGAPRVRPLRRLALAAAARERRLGGVPGAALLRARRRARPRRPERGVAPAPPAPLRRAPDRGRAPRAPARLPGSDGPPVRGPVDRGAPA